MYGEMVERLEALLPQASLPEEEEQKVTGAKREV